MLGDIASLLIIARYVCVIKKKLHHLSNLYSLILSLAVRALRKWTFTHKSTRNNKGKDPSVATTCKHDSTVKVDNRLLLSIPFSHQQVKLITSKMAFPIGIRLLSFSAMLCSWGRKSTILFWHMKQD